MDAIKSQRCPYCEGNEERHLTWRKTFIYEENSMKRVPFIEIYCPFCNRTISVIPPQLFLQD